PNRGCPSTCNVRASRVETSSASRPASPGAATTSIRRAATAQRPRPRLTASMRYGRASVASTASRNGASAASGGRSLPSLPSTTVAPSGSTTACSCSPLRSSARAVVTTSKRRARGTPWMPGSPRASPSKPGGCAAGAGSPPPSRPPCSASRRCSGTRCRNSRIGSAALLGVPARLDGPALAIPLHLPLELVDELVDRQTHVGRRLARAQRRPLREDRRFRNAALRDRGVLLLGKLQLDLRGLGEQLAELGELALRVLANAWADLDVLPLHLKPHRRLLGGGQSRSRRHPSAPLRRHDAGSALSDSACERHHVNGVRARSAEGSRRRRGGRPGRVDVVDEQHHAGQLVRGCDKRSGHV